MQRILVALDGSKRGPHVLDTAAALAKRLDAKLVLFRAIGLPAELPPDLWKHPEHSLLEMLKEGAEQYLVEQARTLDPALRGGIEIAIGTPWEAICSQATKNDVDLIAIGSHGYRGVDRLLGTTAAKVCDLADCSVLVIRPKPAASERTARR